MNKKVFLLLVFLYFFSILSYDIEGKLARPTKSFGEGGKVFTQDTQEAQVTTTSTGQSFVNPSTGEIISEQELNNLFIMTGVNSDEYALEDLMNNHELFQFITEYLGNSLLILEENQAAISYSGSITTHGGVIYIVKDVIDILDDNGVGVFKGDVIETIKYEKVRNILKKEIEVKKLIFPDSMKSEVKIIYACRGSTIWKALGDDVVYKFISPESGCPYGCENGECIDKEFSDEILLTPKEESVEKIEKDLEPEIKKEGKILFVKSQPLSVEEITKKVKPFLVSSKCKPVCNNECGFPDGCGGYCGSNEVSKSGKCGNSIKVMKPENAAEAYTQTTSNIAGAFQIFFKFLLVD